MKSQMEQIKEKMKEEYAKKVDQYFSGYEELKEKGKFNIDGIEKLLGEGIGGAKEVLIETMEEMMKGAELNTAGKKKHANAGRH